MGDSLLRSFPMILTPSPVGGLRRSTVAMRRRGVWQWRFGASDLNLVYSTENPDGSVVFRFGTASEIAEYLALKEAEETEVIEEVDDVILEENIVSVDSLYVMSNELVEESENVGSISDKIVVESRFEKDLRTYVKIGVTDGDLENVLGSENVYVQSSSLLGDISESNLEMDKVKVEDAKRSYDDFGDNVGKECNCVENLDTLDENADRYAFKELVFVESIVSDEDLESCAGDQSTVLEDDIILDPVALELADDFNDNVGTENNHVENLDTFGENAEGNALEELVVVASIISDEDLESYAGDQSTVLEDDIILDPVALEPDVTVSVSLGETSCYSDDEDVSIHTIDEGINNMEENSYTVDKIIDVSGYNADAIDDINLLTVEETRLSAEEIKSDDNGIPVVNGALNATEEIARDSDKVYAALEQTSTSEVIPKENTMDSISLLSNITDSIYVAEILSVGEISNQKDCFQTTDASGSLLAAVPANLSTNEGGFSDKCSNEPSMIRDTVDTAPDSSNQEDAHGSNSVAINPVASQLENVSILDEMIKFDIEDDFVNATSIGSVNQATPTSEVNELSEGGIVRNSVTTVTESWATQLMPAQVAVREEDSPAKLRLSIGAALLPKTSEALAGGEDAYFIAGESWFGVADGVGPWSLEGIDAGLYGHELMECCRRIVSDGDCSLVSTNELLSRSASEATLPGSATVLVAYFDGHVLHASNIGDTGFVIVRNGVILSRSSPTIHDFHFPHQIQKGDNPLELVEVYGIELNEGDIIVAATDCLFDNMYDQEIATIVTNSLQANMSCEEVAAVLAVKAQEIGKSAYTRSPFADAAQAAGYATYTGGKLDDVAVIVSVVQKS